MRSKCKSDEVIRLACIKLKIPKSGTAVSWAIFTLRWVTGIWFPEKRNYITFGSESHHYLVKRFPYDRQSQVWDLIALNVGFMSYLEIEFILTAVVESLTGLNSLLVIHDDVIKWKHFPRYWPFARGIHRSPVNSPHKGQWRGALMFYLICVWINVWVNNREAGDLRPYRAHYDVIVM